MDDLRTIVAQIVSGAPYPSKRSQNKATDILDAIEAAGYVILPAAGGKPAAWMDDGSLRAGSERTAHRVITDEQKRDMPNAVRSSFNVPLFRGTPAAEVQAIRVKALEEAANAIHDEWVANKGLNCTHACAVVRALKGAKP